jgi:hypothetical protein
MNTKIIVGIVVCLVLLSSSGAFAYMKKRDADAAVKLQEEEAAAAYSAATAAAAAAAAATAATATSTPPATSTPTPAQKSTTQIVYMYNDGPPSHGGSGPRRMPLYPGASIDAVVGRKKDSATTYLMTTYPQLALRVVPYGTLVTYEPRSDRVTVVYDRYTERVISATIG